MHPTLHTFRTYYNAEAGAKANLAPEDYHHEMTYFEWGDRENLEVLVCVHGLTRNAHDFDQFAAELAKHYRVLCPNIVGRGDSKPLHDPKGYGYPTYVEDMRQFVASLGVKQVDWVGTSMGGLIGMYLQDTVPGCIRKMVLNDIGPYIPAESLQRISKYVGVIPEFVDLDSAERHMRKAYAPFGITKEEDWRYFTKHSVYRLPNGKYTMAYDPAIAKSSFQTDPNTPIPAFEAWDLWKRLSHYPILVVHGETSDILQQETIATMQQLSATTDLITVEGVGHAPALITPKLIGDIASWLTK